MMYQQWKSSARLSCYPPLTGHLSSGENIPSYSMSKRVLHCNAHYVSHPKIVISYLTVPSLSPFFYISPVGGKLGICKTIHKIQHSSGRKWILILPVLESERSVGLVSQHRTTIMGCCSWTWLAAPTETIYRLCQKISPYKIW
jgi:hypothetical protein